jgi:hypothetical protein
MSACSTKAAACSPATAAVARGADHVVLATVRAISMPKARISGRLGPAEGVTCMWRADPAGRTSAPGPKVTEARARRGAELETNDRDPRGQPHSPVGSRSLFLSRGHPTRGLGGPEQWQPSARATLAAITVTRSADVVWEQRLDALEARIEHLEGELEGLQDAVYRHALLEDENIGELRRRMEPEQMARDLSRDARRRGL